ncbi:MAG TPA: EAL domain-containing protein [Acetobacteraceae bacterium]|nr:EAL domain-containing protein [Acetobacteraceae bacterium]
MLSLRLSLFLGFAALSLITGSLGLYASYTIRGAAALVVDIYDRSLMSINYARAANADFAVLKSILMERRLVVDPAHRARLDVRLDQIRKDLDDDLSIAAERAQSERAIKAVNAVRRAVAGWQDSWSRHEADANWAALDRYADAAAHQIDLLVNYTAGDGFSFRQAALAAIETETRLSTVLTVGAIALSLLMSWPLGRRIMRPVSAASSVAERIAGGELDVEIPKASGDELGRLLASMAVMRDSISQMMAREVAQRRSAQARLTDAIESSREGVILVNAEGRVVVSNSQTFEFFQDLAHLLRPGAFFPDFVAALLRGAMSDGQEGAALRLPRSSEDTQPVVVELRDGRSVRIGWSVTVEGGIVAFCSDMTEWKIREAQLKQSNLWLDAALSNMSQGLCLFDPEGRLKIVNRRFCEIFGLTHDAVRVGMTAEELISLKVRMLCVRGASAAQIWAERRAMLSERRTFTVQMPLLDGRIIEVAHQPMADGGWVATYEDATERYRSREKILFMASHDTLTGLPNRLLFSERLDEAFASAETQKRFALLFIDLDHFKSVNDTLGHPVGDRLLHAVAQRLASCARAADTIARLGGDEFATLLTDLHQVSDAAAYAERVIELVRAPFTIHGHRIAIGASIGIAVAPDHGTDRDTLMRNADIALYRAKLAGRSAYRLFKPTMEAEVQARRTMELELDQALACNQLELHYQPVFDTPTLALIGFEALLRWRHPARGLISAAEFIAVAEDTEAINAIGDWVLREACRTASFWPPHLRLAINVSPVQLRTGSFLDQLESVLKTERLPPERLELEVTETVLLERNDSTLKTLQRIQAAGIAVALDDFGTGYSSLSYLQNFSFNRIKIDQCFVRGIPDDESASAIVRAIIGLGRSLGIPTTAEGVQDERQLAILHAEGCQDVQGFLLGRPVPASGLGPLLAQAVGTVQCGVLRSQPYPIAARKNAACTP